jgi:hypothetical protein
VTYVTNPAFNGISTGNGIFGCLAEPSIAHHAGFIGAL